MPPSRPQPNETPSRFVVGIDLGTTNSAVAYVDTAESPWRVRTFAVPQLVAPGQVEARETLPSCHYEPAVGELGAGALRMPWQKTDPDHVVGFFARDHGAMVPGRLIVSAKSWLCHSGVDRTAPLLPWHGAPDVERLSPVDASGRYLAHVRDAWDAQHPDHALAQQDIVLTLPASFDEIARELTVKAASRAGLARVVLVEEPQAAFYAWIYNHTDDWEKLVSPGQKILVCDIGGGTSDFTLIRVRGGAGAGKGDRHLLCEAPSGPFRQKVPVPFSGGGKVQFHRVAVGEHLILGGDNLDLALAHDIERRLAGDGKLEPRQWAVLVRKCQIVKETLLGNAAPERLTVTLPAGGSRLIGGGLQVELTREDAHGLLLDGFFPRVRLDDKPASRRSGFQEFGLPYAPDAAVTRYLAAFLTAHRHVALDETEAATDHDPARPDVVLCNGGLFESGAIRQRLLDVLTGWFRPEDPKWQPIVLDNDRLDLAVARGAAYYGMVRRGQGVRIAAGLARTYYIGVEGPHPSPLPKGEGTMTLAVCLVPAGVEPGHDVDLSSRRFDLLVSQPVEFPLFVSSTRLTDKPGELVTIDREQMTPLPPVSTVLRTGKKGESGSISVELHARLTEIGTLDLWCSQTEGRRSWRLQFDVRSATQTDLVAHESAAEREGFLDESIWQRTEKLIQDTFGPDGKEKPEGLVKRLAEAIGASRNDWPASLLRRIWEALIELEPGRRRSPVHEARWLNLLGFALRPGYGLAVDDWRVAETWRRLQGGLVHPAAMCRAEWWILWRRIAGGLTAGWQQALADPLLGPIRGLHHQTTTGRGRGGDFSFGSHESAEIWRFLGSLEFLSVPIKIELGGILLDLLPRRKLEAVRPAIAWALGRIGARQPLYGPLNTVVPPEAAAAWLKKLMELRYDDPMAYLAIMLLARQTDDRYRDLSERLRAQVLAWLTKRAAPQHFLQLIEHSGTLDTEEQGLIFGESLPKGLRIL